MRIIRTLAVSGATAVALISGAGVASATEQEAPAVSQEMVQRAAGARVEVPGAGTVHVRGMESAGYRADAAHHQVVTTLASGDDTTTQPDQQVGPQDSTGQQQMQVQPAKNVQTTAASGGTISVAVAIGIGLAFAVVIGVRKSHVRPVWAIACVALGVYLTPTFVGPLITQLGGSLGSSLGNVWSGL